MDRQEKGTLVEDFLTRSSHFERGVAAKRASGPGCAINGNEGGLNWGSLPGGLEPPKSE